MIMRQRPRTEGAALGRRRLLRRAALQGAAVLAATMPAVARAAGSGARATGAATKTVVTFSPVPWGTPQERADLYGTILRPFLDQNRGLEVRLVFQPRGNFGGTSANILAGTAPDVFEDYQIGGQLMEGGFLLDLTPQIKQSNANMSLFPKAQLNYFNLNGKQYAMPVSIESVVAVVNKGILQEQGLAVPEDDWNYKQAEELYRKTARLTGSATSKRYGGAFYFYNPTYPEEYYLDQFGGSYVKPDNLAQCNLAAPGSIAAGEYIYSLLQDGVCTTDWADGKLFQAGQLTFSLAGTWMLPQYAAIPASISWQFLPLPAGPVRAATFGSPAFYAIPRTTKVPDAAWALLEWISFSPYLQIANMKFGLLPPARMDLYQEWISVVQQVAPPLRNVHLEAFNYRESHDIDPYFKYNTASAFQIIAKWTAEIMQKKVSVQQGFTAAAKQVDAYEAAQASATGKANGKA